MAKVESVALKRNSVGSSATRRFYLVLMVCMLVVQCCLLSIALPISELITDKPIFYYDTAYHWYEIWFAQSIAQTGNWVGYDPYFSAGLVNGVNLNFSAKAAVLIAIVGGHNLSPALAYKLLMVSTAVIAPTSLVLGAYWLGLSRAVGFVAALLAVIMWWASDFRSYTSIGMVAWSGACFMAIPYMALSLRYLVCETVPVTLLMLAAIAGLATLFHPAFSILVAFGLMVLAGMYYRDLNWGRVAAYVIIIPVATLALNYFWIYAAITYAPSAVGGFLPTPSLAEVDPVLPWKLMLGQHSRWPYGSKVYVLLALCGTFACFAAVPVRDRAIARALFAGSALLLVFGAIGAAFPGLAYVQPNRYCQAGFAMAILPASAGMVTLFRDIFHKTAASSQPLRLGVSWIGAIVATVGMMFYLNEVRRELSSASIGHYGAIPPEVRGIGDTTMAIRRWIEGNTNNSGRILFELTAGKKLDSAQIVGYLAASTGREFISGPYPTWAYASFEDAKAFGIPIESIPPEKFFRLLELYNVTWIAAWHTKSLQYLDGLAGLERLEQVGPLRFYRVTREANYFLAGSGKVLARSPNSLSLEELTGSEVVLKYHFVKGLVTEPPAQIEPALVGSPAPFIKLVNPPPKLRIFLRLVPE